MVRKYVPATIGKDAMLWLLRFADMNTAKAVKPKAARDEYNWFHQKDLACYATTGKGEKPAACGDFHPDS